MRSFFVSYSLHTRSLRRFSAAFSLVSLLSVASVLFREIPSRFSCSVDWRCPLLRARMHKLARFLRLHAKFLISHVFNSKLPPLAQSRQFGEEHHEIRCNRYGCLPLPCSLILSSRKRILHLSTWSASQTASWPRLSDLACIDLRYISTDAFRVLSAVSLPLTPSFQKFHQTHLCPLSLPLPDRLTISYPTLFFLVLSPSLPLARLSTRKYSSGRTRIQESRSSSLTLDRPTLWSP